MKSKTKRAEKAFKVGRGVVWVPLTGVREL